MNVVHAIMLYGPAIVVGVGVVIATHWPEIKEFIRDLE